MKALRLGFPSVPHMGLEPARFASNPGSRRLGSRSGTMAGERRLRCLLLFWRSCRVHHGKGDELLFPSICLARHPDSFSRFAANGSSSCRGALVAQFECEVRLPNPNTTMGCEAWADSPRTVHGFAPRHLRSQLRWPASIRAQRPCATTTIANKLDSAPTFRSHVLRSSTGARRALCNCPIGYWIHLARRFLQD